MVSQLEYVINTHVHADHITGSGSIKNKFMADGGPEIKSVISRSSGASANIHLEDQEDLLFGKSRLQAIYTPGQCAFLSTLSVGSAELIVFGV